MPLTSNGALAISLAIFLLPHIGLSARKASTASTRAGGHLGLRRPFGRRDFGSGAFSHRYSVGRATPTACAAVSALRPPAIARRQRVASSRRFLVGLRVEKTRRRPAVSDNMAGQAKNLHRGVSRGWSIRNPQLRRPPSFPQSFRLISV